MFNLVLWEPEIPPNTGNVARLAVALGMPLHLIGPLGFQITDRQVKRAGLDYWERLDLRMHANRAAFEAAHGAKPAWYFTTKAKANFWDVCYQPGDFLVFGSETRGLPADVLEANPDRCVVIPHGAGVRSLNLSNCAAIGAYEAIRQNRDVTNICSKGQDPWPDINRVAGKRL